MGNIIAVCFIFAALLFLFVMAILQKRALHK